MEMKMEIVMGWGERVLIMEWIYFVQPGVETKTDFNPKKVYEQVKYECILIGLRKVIISVRYVGPYSSFNLQLLSGTSVYNLISFFFPLNRKN